MRRFLLFVCACPALVACSREKPLAPPELARVDVTPPFGELERQDPEASLPRWKREHGIVLGDLRSAHPFKADAELLLPVPPAATRVATAFAAHRKSGTERAGDVALTIELQESGTWRRIGGWNGPLARLLDAWAELEVPLATRAGSASRARVRASLTGAAADAIEFLVEPLRAVADAATGSPAAHPNVLILSIDTLRADHLSSYGYRRATSPRIDALAREGVLFEKVVAAAPWTLPSYGSLFTGCTPAVHRAGVNTAHEERFGRDEDTREDGLEILRADLPTLAEAFRAAGWATAGFQANSFLRAKNGIDRGFDRWVFYQYHAPVGIELALEWIGKHASGPWFCFLHVMDVHQPYVPPAPYDRKFSQRSFRDLADYPPPIDDLRARRPDDATVQLLVDQYDGAIAYTDDQVGQMLDRLKEKGLLDDTLVVVHSDHGEEFWEHGGYEHGHSEYTEVLDVPLILRLPRLLPANRRVASRVRLLDLMPTFLDVLGVAPVSGIEGRSLVPLIGGKPEPPRECISEATLHGLREIKALTILDESLILSGGGSGKLFDLAKDPGELADLAADKSSRARDLEERLRRRHDVILQSAVRARAMQLTDAERKRLRELGYTDVDEPR
ncbi:MAG TPA: sulfatase [Planctomycetota bacterium]|nr:sulfatase [Planctomycetota bacterium]